MKNKQRCGKKDAPTGCGSREGQGCTVRKHPSVHVKHSRCCNKKKKRKKKLINKQLRGESWRRRRRRSVPKSPHILMKCWSGVPGCCLPSLPSSTHAHTHTHTHTQKNLLPRPGKLQSAQVLHTRAQEYVSVARGRVVVVSGGGARRKKLEGRDAARKQEGRQGVKRRE